MPALAKTWGWPVSAPSCTCTCTCTCAHLLTSRTEWSAAPHECTRSLSLSDMQDLHVIPNLVSLSLFLDGHSFVNLAYSQPERCPYPHDPTTGVKSIHFPLPSLDDRAINPTTSVDRGHSNEKNGRATLAIIPSIQSMAPAYKRRPPHPLLSIIRTPSHPSTLSLPPASPPLFRSIGGRVLASCSRRPHNTYLILSIHLSSNSM